MREQIVVHLVSEAVPLVAFIHAGGMNNTRKKDKKKQTDTDTDAADRRTEGWTEERMASGEKLSQSQTVDKGPHSSSDLATPKVKTRSKPVQLYWYCTY